MSIDTLQNFFSTTVSLAWATGTGNRYITTLPTNTSGYLVINPGNTAKREIVRYSGIGTDGSGNYITTTERGIGGTTDQTHAIGEAVRLNITAEHWEQVKTAIEEAVFAGASYSDATTIGVAKLSEDIETTIGTATITIASPAVITRTAHGLESGDRIKFTTTGALPTGLSVGTYYYVLSAGLTANDFRLSDAPAGTVINTSGTQSGIHTLINTTPVALSNGDPRIPTQDEKDALAGVGTPSSANKFITASEGISNDNVTQSGTQTSFTTSTNTIEVGEADATTKKNKITDTFVATKTKIRGVNLYKKTDTGTFTGTVTVALYANSGGSPTGSALATQTLTNLQWLALTANSSFEVLFTSEYASLVVGDTYHIQTSTSTSDNANHPNLGGVTSGGVGTLKYNNTTDGWVTIAGGQLYLETLEGNNSQVVKTTATGSIPTELLANTFEYEFVNSPATWTKPADLKSVLVRLWAGGGGGGKSDTSYAGGGGGGAYSEIYIKASDLGATETVTIGAGGAGATTAGVGSVGGNSSFGSHVTVYGGGAGGGATTNLSAGGGGGGQTSAGAVGGSNSTNAVGGLGGTPRGVLTATDGTSLTFGDANSAYECGVNTNGGGGGGSLATSSVKKPGPSTFGGGGGGPARGDGAFSSFGGGGGAGSTNSGTTTGGISVSAGNGGNGSTGAGTAGQVPAGGGAGSTGATGGAGGNGRVIVTEFY